MISSFIDVDSKFWMTIQLGKGILMERSARSNEKRNRSGGFCIRLYLDLSSDLMIKYVRHDFFFEKKRGNKRTGRVIFFFCSHKKFLIGSDSKVKKQDDNFTRNRSSLTVSHTQSEKQKRS